MLLATAAAAAGHRGRRPVRVDLRAGYQPGKPPGRWQNLPSTIKEGCSIPDPPLDLRGQPDSLLPADLTRGGLPRVTEPHGRALPVHEVIAASGTPADEGQ